MACQAARLDSQAQSRKIAPITFIYLPFMKLTLALPALNRSGNTALPPLGLTAFDQLLRFGRFTQQPQPASVFYGRYLWQGSLIAAAKQALNLPETQPAVLVSPVWQQMGMNHVDMISASAVGITAKEAERFCVGLNELYADEDWYFSPLRPDLWLAALPAEPDWQVPPLLDVLGAADGSLRAEGRDSGQWLQKQTEIQMWLYNHPLNNERAAAGMPAVNGVWLWQDIEGSCDAAPLLAADSPWAQFYPGAKLDAPYDFAAWQTLLAEQTQPVSDGLLFLDDLTASAHTGDTGAYVHTLQSFETRWFAPLWQTLCEGRLNSLRIVTDGDQGGELLVNAKARRAFWKKKRRFTGLLGG